MDPISIIAGFFSSFLASALHVAAEKHDSGFRIRRIEKYEKLHKLLSSSHTIEKDFETAIATSFRNLSPIEANNKFFILFDDIDFRKILLEWIFELDKNKKKEFFNNMNERANKLLGNSKIGNEAVTFISNSFNHVVQENQLLANVVAHEERKSILELLKESVHMIKTQFHDVSQKLNDIIEEIKQHPKGLLNSIKIAKEFNLYTENVLKRLKISIPIINEIDRIEHSFVLKAAMEKSEVLIHGEAGTGKTGIVARIAKELFKMNECVLFIRADEIAGQFNKGKCTTLNLAEAMDFNRPLTELIMEVIDSVGRVWLFIDQLDQISNQPIRFAFSELINRLRNRDGCRIIISCRSYEATKSSYLEELFCCDKSVLKITIPELAPETVCDSLKKLNLNPDLKIVRFCGNLLNLYLLASLVKRKVVVSNINAEGELWNALRDELAKENGLIDAICGFAEQSMVSTEGDQFFSESPLAERLASWGILINHKGPIYGFRHERLRDYYFAYDSVLRKNENLISLMNRLRNPARAKTVIPWVVQISGSYDQNYCAKLIKDAFSEKITSSVFPKIAIIDSIHLIDKITSSLALSIWNASQQFPRAIDIINPVESNPNWINAFWEAGIFHKAITINNPANKKLFDYLDILLEQRPDDFISLVNQINQPPTNIQGIVKALNKLPIESIIILAPKLSIWIKSGQYQFSGYIHLLIEKITKGGYKEIASDILSACLEPIIERHRDNTWIRERWMIFMHMREFFQNDKYKTILGIPCEYLIPFLKKHIAKLRALTQNIDKYKNFADPFIRWGSLSLFTPGKTDSAQEWMLWYGLYHNALIGVLNNKKTDHNVKEMLEELIQSSDYLLVRIGLDLILRLKRIPIKIVLKALDKGVFLHPSTLGESILILSTVDRKKQNDIFNRISSDIAYAIRKVDNSRSNISFFSFPYRKDTDIKKWAKKILFKSSNKNIQEISNFILGLENDEPINKNITYTDIVNHCKNLIIPKIYNGGQVTFSGGKMERVPKATYPEYEALDELASKLSKYVVPRFNLILKQAKQTDDLWVSDKVGYVILRAAISRIDYRNHETREEYALKYAMYKHKQKNNEPMYGWINADNFNQTISIEAAKNYLKKNNIKVRKPRRYTVPVLELLKSYNKIFQDSSKYSRPIRSLFAGFLSKLLNEAPNFQYKKYHLEIKNSLRNLSMSTDAGCVKSMIRPLEFGERFWSTASKSVHALIEHCWNINFKSTNADDEFLKWVFNPKRKKNERLNPELICIKDREAVISAFEKQGDQQKDVLMILGMHFMKLVNLDHILVDRLLTFLKEKHISLSQAFVNGLEESKARWLCFPNLQNTYSKIINDKKGKVSKHVVWDVSCAFLIYVENEEDYKNKLFYKLLKNLNDKDRGKCIAIICEAYHWLGQDPEHWMKIRILWQKAVNCNSNNNPCELIAFENCFLNAHVPEPLSELAPLLEKSVCLNPKKYDNKLIPTIQYLSSQAPTYPELAIALLEKAINVEDDFPYYGMDSDEEITILKNAILSGGNAYDIAVRLIERQELSKRRSLAGLLL